MLKTNALILSAMKYRESSMILDMYTEQQGRVSFIISGVRAKKSKSLTNMLQPGYWVELIAYFKSGKSLNRIKEIKPAILYREIPFAPAKRAIAIFSTEVVSRAVKGQEAQAELFDFLKQYFIQLDNETESVANYPILIMLVLSDYLGIKPSIRASDDQVFFDLIDGVFTQKLPEHLHSIKEPMTSILNKFLSLDFQGFIRHDILSIERQRLLTFWVDYYKIHIEHFSGLKSLSVLRDIFS